MLLCCQLSTLVKSLPRNGEIINHLIFESKALESSGLLKEKCTLKHPHIQKTVQSVRLHR